MPPLLQAKPHTSSRCIQCMDPATLTEEHVFADGAGGHLIAYILCRDCNGHFGRNIDAPYLTQPVVELARNAFRIGGRRNVIPQPLKGPYTVPGPAGKEAEIKLDIDFRPKVITQVGDVEVREDGALVINMLFDASDRDKIPVVVRSKLERFFKSERGRALSWTAEEQEHAITSTIDGYMAAPNRETPAGELATSMTNDFGTMFLEPAKVAFEIAAIEDGDEFIHSAPAAAFRKLLQQAVKGRIESMPTFQDMLKAFQAVPLPHDSGVFQGLQAMTGGKASEHHMAILNGRHVVVSMFGDAYIFANLRPAGRRDAYYTNNVVTGEVRRLAA